jgi:hypothetical protein
MGELSQMTAQPVECEIGGKAYKLAPLTVGDFAALESYIRSRHIAEYRKACEGLDPVIVATGIEHIIKDAVDSAGDSSISSTVFLLHRSISKHDPAVTLEAVGEMVTLANMQEITGIIRALGAPEKNSQGAKVDD